MVTLTAITVYFLYITSNRLRNAAYDVQSTKALWLAEAGLQKYMYYLKVGTYDVDDHPSINENLGEGSYSVPAPAYDADTFTYSFASTGDVGVIDRVITQTVSAPAEAIERAIHADGAHLKFDGSTGTITGNVSCFVSVLNEEGMTITGTITEGDEQDKISPTIELTSYETRATALGQVAANKTFESGNTYNDVWYITSSATIESDVIIAGSIICEKAIAFDGKADDVLIDPNLDADLNGLNYPALYAGTSITSTDTGSPSKRIGLQNSSINGLVMADSNITFNYLKDMSGAGLAGSNTEGYQRGFTGTIIAINNIEMSDSINDFNVTYNADIFAPMPPGFGFTGGAVITPQKDWNES